MSLGSKGKALMPPDRLAFAKKMGVPMVRFEGTLPLRGPLATSRARSALDEAGLKLVITLGNRSGKYPSRPPTDAKAFARDFSGALDILRPDLIALENEEGLARYYLGSASDYAKELAIAVPIAHSRGIPITNGGITMIHLVPLVLDSYASNGNEKAAASFAARMVGTVRMMKGLSWPAIRETEFYRRGVKEGKEFLSVFRQSQMDYVNFHWYSSDAKAMEETVRFLQKETGKPVITHELGQRDENPRTVTELLKAALDLHLAHVCWFDGDGSLAYSLRNPDGSLRTAGVAFREFLKAHFSEK